MATTLQGQWDATYGPTIFTGGQDPLHSDPIHFQQRVAMATTQVAVTVALEGIGTVNHANRVALARDVLANPLKWMGPLTQAAASQALEQTNASDGQIVAIILAGWNAIAGAL
jgi:hypothetical protein